MDTQVTSVNAKTPDSSHSSVPVLALASTFALAAAGTLFACSLLPSIKRRIPVPGQVCLGALVACFGALTWRNRQQELDAARNIVAHVHQARDTRWLKKNPVAYA